MSRCFPFPPPGYEKKARTGDIGLLTKEKHKEKKHKKEKRDKEKREGKDKKDKERSKDKHKEKKDRKEKNKEKKDKDETRTSDEKKIEKRLEGYNGKNEVVKNSKFVEDLGEGIADGGVGNRVTDQGRGQRVEKAAEKDFVRQSKGNEFVDNKKRDDRRADGQKNGNEERGMGDAGVQNPTERIAGMVRPIERVVEKRMEEREKIEGKEGDDKQGHKHKGRDQEKKNKGKDKNKEKEKKKEKDKVKKSEQKNKENDKLRESRKELVDTIDIKLSNVSTDSEKSVVIEGNLRKRKEFETNGFLNDIEIRPNKLPRPISSFQPLMKNGKKLELCQTSLKYASDRQGITINGKGHKINGVIEGNENDETSTKPPHPDSKYLNQLFCIPKVENCSDIDDQKWLFGTENAQLKKPQMEMGSSRVDENLQVWAKALQIESADICALPYVIPY